MTSASYPSTPYGGSPRKTAITASLVISVANHSRSNTVRFDRTLLIYPRKWASSPPSKAFNLSSVFPFSCLFHCCEFKVADVSRIVNIIDNINIIDNRLFKYFSDLRETHACSRYLAASTYVLQVCFKLCRDSGVSLRLIQLANFHLTKFQNVSYST